MFEGIFNFIADNIFGKVIGVLPVPVQFILYLVLALVGVFSGRKFIFINLVMRFFPNLFVKMMKDLGIKANQVFESKKEKGKFKGVWKKAEEKLIEGIDSFNAEVKKD